MSSLPKEIYHDILLRLPGKYLVSCKYARKSWYKLISDPRFIKSHLNLANQRNNYRLMFECDEMNSVNSISYDSLSSSKKYDDAVVVEMDFSNTSSKCKSEMLGSFNGLVYGLNNQLKFFFLWNPATKEYKRLPKSDTYYCSSFHGFGYDYKADDFKLVLVRDICWSFRVQVYSLKSKSWKSFETIQRYGMGTYYVTYSGVFLNGVLHWPGKPGNKIVTMDISEEGFEVLKLPITNDYDFMSIGVLEGRLCVLCDVEKSKTFEVWVMQDYGVLESWTKLYAIGFGRRKYHSSMVELSVSLKNGKILFKNDPIRDGKNSVFLYDPQCRTARQLNITGLNDGEAFSYFESLVSLKSSTLGKRKRKESLET